MLQWQCLPDEKIAWKLRNPLALWGFSGKLGGYGETALDFGGNHGWLVGDSLPRDRTTNAPQSSGVI